jgi:hypothetical protein
MGDAQFKYNRCAKAMPKGMLVVPEATILPCKEAAEEDTQAVESDSDATMTVREIAKLGDCKSWHVIKLLIGYKIYAKVDTPIPRKIVEEVLAEIRKSQGDETA